MKAYDKHYIGGKWLPARSSDRFDVTNSSNEAVIGRVPVGTAEDADLAVTAAADARPNGG